MTCNWASSFHNLQAKEATWSTANFLRPTDFKNSERQPSLTVTNSHDKVPSTPPSKRHLSWKQAQLTYHSRLHSWPKPFWTCSQSTLQQTGKKDKNTIVKWARNLWQSNQLKWGVWPNYAAASIVNQMKNLSSPLHRLIPVFDMSTNHTGTWLA